MPRTKVSRKSTIKNKADDDKERKMVLEKLEEIRKEAHNIIEKTRTGLLAECRQHSIEQRMKIPSKYFNMKMSEIKQLAVLSSTSCVLKEDLFNGTKSMKTKRTAVKRSSSCADDEGYLTTESITSGPRSSRAKVKTTRVNRTTRSLSRSSMQKVPAQFKTPTQPIPPNSYGVITPKCNPNTPQVLLRRPRLGEVAMSMQGSPLMTASVMTDHKANINIPLPDGTLLSLQAQEGLRLSQIPDFERETLSHLETLLENLSKVCKKNNL